MCPARLNTQSFIKKAQALHGDLYNYSLVEYVNNRTKVTIICSEHGEFLQQPNNHLIGNGCYKCGTARTANAKKHDTKEFIRRARLVHGTVYDYSEVVYVHNLSKVKIICPTHGAFEQVPDKHIQGNGCSKCAIEKTANAKRSNTQAFVEKAGRVHNYFYDYKLVNYAEAALKVDIVCLKHGAFPQTPNDHLSGYGCPKCGIEKNSGQTHYKWDESKSDEERHIGRRGYSIEIRAWRKSVFARDFYKCQSCKSKKSGTIQAHHILPWSKFPSDRFEVDNGVTLCKSCHRKYHSTYKLDKCDRDSMNAYLVSNAVREVVLSV